MKKIIILLTYCILMGACSNNGGESGTVNDGFNGAGDTNGGLADTPYTANPSIDSAKGEHRVDTERRDSTNH